MPPISWKQRRARDASVGSLRSEALDCEATNLHVDDCAGRGLGEMGYCTCRRIWQCHAAFSIADDDGPRGSMHLVVGA